MKKLIKNRLVFFLLFIIIYSLFNKYVYGQQFTLSLSPPILELIIKPGKSILVAYNLENLGDPTYLTAKVVSFEAYNNLGNIRLKEKAEGPLRFSLDNSEINLNQPFFLKTRQKEQLLLRIKVVDGAPEGDYYYTLLVSSQPREVREEEFAGATRATVGANILITITDSGKIQAKGKIAFFDVIPRWRLSFGNKSLNLFESNDIIPIVLIVENKGKNVVKPQGKIVLKGNFGTKAEYEVLPQNILTESQRLLIATPSAQMEIKKPTTLVLQGFFIGRYQLATNINFGLGTTNLFAHTSFIALPFKFLLGVLIASIVIIFLIKKERE